MFIRSKLFFISIILVFQCLFILSAKSAKAADDFYNIPLMKKSPPMNGIFKKSQWKDTFGFDGFSYQGVLQPRQTKCYIGATKNKLYFEIITKLPSKGHIIAQVKDNSSNIVFDDAMEIWIDPYAEKSNGITYQVLFNSLGYRYYLAHPRGVVKTSEWYGWDGHYKIINTLKNGYWYAEVEVPVSNLEKGRKITDGKWEINVCRDYKQPWGWGSLGNGGYAFASNNIIFKFIKRGIFIQQQNKSNLYLGDINTELTFYNDARVKKHIQYILSITRDIQPRIIDKKNIIINPGQIKKIDESVIDYATNKFNMDIKVSSLNGKKILYTRSYKWDSWKGIKQSPWQIAKQSKKQPFNFLFAYYPYLNKMKIRADITGLNKNAKLKELQFSIINRKNNQLIKKFEIAYSKFKKGVYREIFKLPPLSGKYQIICTAKGENIPSYTIKKNFVRTVFPWEHNKLGISNKVYPPFTPIKVHGNNVYTVMKKYRVNSIGLLSSVKTLDPQRVCFKEILNGPMVYKAVIDGNKYTINSGKTKFTRIAGNVVKMESSFNAGDAKFITKSKIEYDGLLKVKLYILPGDHRINNLVLDIPFNSKIARMMSAMTSGIRYGPFTDYIPEGKGIIWDSKKLVAPDPSFKNFCTYIFIGNPNR
jgi:hypothetical protein